MSEATSGKVLRYLSNEPTLQTNLTLPCTDRGDFIFNDTYFAVFVRFWRRDIASLVPCEDDGRSRDHVVVNQLQSNQLYATCIEVFTLTVLAVEPCRAGRRTGNFTIGFGGLVMGQIDS